MNNIWNRLAVFSLVLAFTFGVVMILDVWKARLAQEVAEAQKTSEFVGLEEDTFLCTRTARSRLVCSNGQEKFAITTFDLGGKAWNGSPRRER